MPVPPAAAAAIAAAAVWKVGRHRQQAPPPPPQAQLRQQPQRHPFQPFTEFSTRGRTLLATLWERSVALAEAGSIKPQALSGTWDKDHEQSDSLDEAVEAMQLGFLVRRGISLVRGVELTVDERDFEMAVFCAIPMFKFREKYPLSGQERKVKRRDLRKGSQVGRAEVLGDGRIVIHAKWGEPHGGTGCDTFSLAGPGVMHADTVLACTGQPVVKWRTVYNLRQDGTRPEE